MEQELKPCPFCGTSHLYVKPDEYGEGMFGVDGTHKPGCPIGNIDMCDYGEPEIAITAWNTRHQSTANLTAQRDALVEALAKALGVLDRYAFDTFDWNADGGRLARGLLPQLEALVPSDLDPRCGDREGASAWRTPIDEVERALAITYMRHMATLRPNDANGLLVVASDLESMFHHDPELNPNAALAAVKG